jgi:transcriptional regulator with XRE-family HTH domain
MRRTAPPFPDVARSMQELGERIRLARLRRSLPQDLLARRAGMSRETLRRIEAGDAGVSFGALANVLHSLGMHRDLDGVAADDELGRSLQDLDLRVPRRAPRKEE